MHIGNWKWKYISLLLLAKCWPPTCLKSSFLPPYNIPTAQLSDSNFGFLPLQMSVKAHMYWVTCSYVNGFCVLKWYKNWIWIFAAGHILNIHFYYLTIWYYHKSSLRGDFFKIVIQRHAKRIKYFFYQCNIFLKTDTQKILFLFFIEIYYEYIVWCC